jgi:phosphate starvation-inducible PhoH-like protein
MRILKNVPEIGFVHLTEEDVVRHPVVKKIILAYNAEEKDSEKSNFLSVLNV